jgi:hypothetical protein
MVMMRKTYPVPVLGYLNAGPKTNSKQAMCAVAIAVIPRFKRVASGEEHLRLWYMIKGAVP